MNCQKHSLKLMMSIESEFGQVLSGRQVFEMLPHTTKIKYFHILEVSPYQTEVLTEDVRQVDNEKSSKETISSVNIHKVFF